MDNRFYEAVQLPYQLYNSLFLTLPFKGVHKAGPLLPLLTQACKEGYKAGKSPTAIVEQFFDERLPDLTPDERQNLLLNFIQYIERQIVLFDAVEDAAYEKIFDLNGKGTLQSLFDRAETRSRLDLLEEKLRDFHIRIVLTAHPTQFYPGDVLAIITDLENAIRDNNLVEVNQLLLQLGKTPFLNKEKPTPYDEAANLTWYLENVFYEAIPRVIGKLHAFLAKHGRHVDLSGLIRMGFWPGGDRDGNPYVDSTTTLKVADRLRQTVLLCHYRTMRQVRRRITFRGMRERLWAIERKIYRTLYGGEGTTYSSAGALLDDLHEARTYLDTAHGGLFTEMLEDLILRVECFGFHFATLDLRQDSRKHAAVWEEILRLKGQDLGLPTPKAWNNLTSAQQMDLLTTLSGQVQPDALETDLAKDVIGSLQTLQTIQQRNGAAGMHRYIISNCATPVDILMVYGFATLAGVDTRQMDIVPLFETVDDLEAAPDTMRTLYAYPAYKAHMDQRQQRQTIMLGFSDGTKDGGYLMANWSIFRAKETLTQASREHAIEVVFFDGRGGPPARGGGNTHNFYASLGSQIEDKAVELTMQGQTISSKFGNLPAAVYNLEQQLTAGLENDVFRGDIQELNSDQRQLIEELAEASHAAYLALKEHPLFVPYLEEITTLPYYGQTNIGSRPVKRNKTDKLKLEDLRAIPFVGSWSQMKQNVPGYYGFGSVLRAMEKQGRLPAVEALYRDSLFFRTLVDNSLMSLAKTFFPLTQYLAQDPKFGEFWARIYTEYQDAVRLLMKIAGQQELLQDSPVIKESVALREEIVLPLITIQQYALQKVHQLEAAGADPETITAFRKLVLRSMFGNINATRNAA